MQVGDTGLKYSLVSVKTGDKILISDPERLSAVVEQCRVKSRHELLSRISIIAKTVVPNGE